MSLSRVVSDMFLSRGARRGGRAEASRSKTLPSIDYLGRNREVNLNLNSVFS